MLNTIAEGDPALPRLLIAHGLYGQARNWGVIARDLSDIRHVVSVDMRNHGQSPWFDNHSYEAMAEDLAEVIGDDGPWDVLGHSMGGKAAMALALTFPEKVRRLIVADIAPVTYDHDQLQHIRAMKDFDPSGISRRGEVARALDTHPRVASFLAQSFDVAQKRWMLNLDVLEAEMPKIMSFPDFDTPYSGPALFLTGEDSTYFLPEHRAPAKKLFPNAHFVKVTGTGHWLHAERPEAVAESCRVFLTS